MTRRTSAEIREQLDHPVLDADGHQLELEPVLLDYLRDIAGTSYPESAHDAIAHAFGWYDMTPEERRDRRVIRPPWGLQAANADDIAACMAPRLLRSRMDEIGIDFGIIYPTMGFLQARLAPRELRSAVCRAINHYNADMFADVRDRLTPAAVLPMGSPEEAVAELEYAVGTLGLKTVVIDCAVPRPVKELAPLIATLPRPLGRFLCWLDTFGLDSKYDYDPLWAKCVELGVSPTSHQAGMWGSRCSPSNYTHNHIGMFGAAGEALCKSLFLAGVTFRFPALKIAFLEGGASWACSLYVDLVEHWNRRNVEAIGAYDPALLDQDRILALLREYGGDRVKRHLDGPLDTLFQGLFRLSGWVPQAGWTPRDKDLLDDFSRCRIAREEDIRDHFVPNFYFGCEAEDPSAVWALKGRGLPFGARLNAIFGSDIGHWDVEDIRAVVAEAYEAVEDGHMEPDDFRMFVFNNTVVLHGSNNPAFFEGTVVEDDAKRVLEAEA